jgi:hypothetical protein
MSLDFPDRKVWLAKRYTPRLVNTERLIWKKGTQPMRC